MKNKIQNRYNNSLVIQQRLSHASNYNSWLFNHAYGYIGDRTLEVGCALGNFTEKLLDMKYLCAIDIEKDYVEAMAERYRSYSNVEVIHGEISSPDILRLKNKEFNSVVCFNVLEHIRDDRAALRHMFQLLEEGGVLVLIVPAFKCLFGTMDVTDHHYRRYNKRDIVVKVRQAGFSVTDAQYFNVLGFFGWWLNGKLLRRKFIPFRQMIAYDKVVPLVKSIEKRLSLPFGQSLFVAAHKRFSTSDE